MSLFRETQRHRADYFESLSYCNPFGPERIACERALLGRAFIETDYAWHKRPDEKAARPNILRLTERSRLLADGARSRILRGAQTGDADLARYEAVVLYYVYNKHNQGFLKCLAHQRQAGEKDPAGAVFKEFHEDLRHYLTLPGLQFSSVEEAPHLFACFFQLRRAFHQIYEQIIGGSQASARLRSNVWESIFTCNMRRARRSLFYRMRDVPTLITGPSGTGKELVAESIALSQYIPFDAKSGRFAGDFTAGYLPVNLSALTPALIESELFGHAKGAFTGALAERKGLFERCSPHGSIFLDELGELDLSIQVKLLRVLQTRGFQRVGDSAARAFHGKVIAATNRDLAQAMRERNFREDLYYRLCADVIETPSLREQLQDSSEQLRNLLLFITRRVAGEAEAEPLALEVEAYIHQHLGADYAWPGNVRELEQCVRNIMVRKRYTPVRHGEPQQAPFLAALQAGRLTADEVLDYYATLVYTQTGSYLAAAQRLGLDRRTVKSRVKPELLHAAPRA